MPVLLSFQSQVANFSSFKFPPTASFVAASDFQAFRERGAMKVYEPFNSLTRPHLPAPPHSFHRPLYTTFYMSPQAKSRGGAVVSTPDLAPKFLRSFPTLAYLRS